MRLRQFWTDRPVRSKGLLVLAVPLLTFVLTAPLFLLSSREDSRTEDRLSETLTLKTQIEATRVLVFESVARIRGYLLTGDQRFLSLYEEAARALPGSVARLNDLTAGDPSDVAHAERVDSLSRELLATLEALRGMRGEPDAHRLVDDSLEIDQAIQGDLDAIAADEDREFAQRRDAAEAADRRLLITVAAVVPVGLVITSLAMLLFTRGISRRVRSVSENAQRLSAGEPFLPMPTGRDEVGKLAEALFETERQLHARAADLRDSEAKLRAVVDNTTSVIFMKDRDGRFLVLNRVFEEQFGMSQGEALGKTVLELFPNDNAGDWHENDLQVMRRRLPLQFEETATTPDGERVYLATKVPVLDEAGQPYALVGISTDITERKRAEEELRRAAEEITDLYENAPCGYHSLDADGRILRINDTELRWLGYERDELLGRPVTDLMTEESRRRFAAQFPAFLESLRLNDLEIELLRKDGTVLPVLVSASAILDEGGNFLSSRSTLLDITEFRAAQSQLQLQGRLLDQVEEAIIAQDAEGRVVSWNNGAAIMYGWSASEIVGRRGLDFIPMDLDDETAAAVYEQISTTGRWRGEIRQRRRDGAWIDAEVDTIVMVTGGRVSVIRDVTERRRAQAELRLSEARYRAIASNFPNGSVALFDRDLRYVVYDGSSLEALGIRREDFEGRTVREAPHRPEIARELERWYQAALAGERTIVEMPRLDRTFLVQISPVEDETGAITGGVQVAVDITERKNAEDEARRLSTFLDSMIENIPDMVFVKDAEELRFVRFNRAGEELLGTSRSELIGKNDYDFFPADQAEFFTSKDREVLASGAMLDVAEEPIRTPSGTRYLHTKKLPLADESGEIRFLLGISEDITERKRAEEEARAAREEAERANRAKSEFLSRMSHELRTPLNAVLGFAQLLESDELGDEQHDNATQILRAGRHLLDLINEVLDISRIEAGKLSLSPEPVRVGDAVKDALDLIRPIADAARISIGLGNRVNGTYVLADRQRLKQVLLNLLSNAVKYNRPEGSVSLEGHRVEDRYRIEVTDTGPGIHPEEVERVFSPFDRLHGGEDVEGTGLGLPLSKGLVEAMGGILSLRSEPGRGSTFTVELPISQSPLEAFAAGGEEPSGIGSTPTAGTILYVEDNLSNLRLIERVLERRPGIRTISAMQGSLGLELAREHLPDLILLDLHLPDMDGIDALRVLRADSRLVDVPIVVISADATQAPIRRALDAGATDYLTKPIDVPRFIALVDELLRNGDEPG